MRVRGVEEAAPLQPPGQITGWYYQPVWTPAITVPITPYQHVIDQWTNHQRATQWAIGTASQASSDHWRDDHWQSHWQSDYNQRQRRQVHITDHAGRRRASESSASAMSAWPENRKPHGGRRSRAELSSSILRCSNVHARLCAVFSRCASAREGVRALLLWARDVPP